MVLCRTQVWPQAWWEAWGGHSPVGSVRARAATRSCATSTKSTGVTSADWSSADSVAHAVACRCASLPETLLEGALPLPPSAASSAAAVRAASAAALTALGS